jgi:crotonobetainyl-CoA:carnitine CoA-transferase CaiB-like acyl-CoA transferase
VLHRSKRNAGTLAAADVVLLASAADVLLIDRDRLRAAGGALDGDRLLAVQPELVHCTVSPFGSAGPLADLPADDALVQAASGIMAMQWSYDGHPVWLNTPLTAYACGMMTALAIAAALRARGSGRGGQRVETSFLGAALLFQSGTYVTGPGSRGTLLGHASDPRGVLPTYAFYRAADDWLFVGALTEVFWVKLCNALERPDLLAHPDLQGIPLSFAQPPERRAFVRRTLEDIFATRPREEWLARLAEHDVPSGPVQDRRTFLRDPQTIASEMAIEVLDPELGTTRQPGVPLRFARTPGAVRGPRRRAGSDAAEWPQRAGSPRRPGSSQSEAAPLAGIRVVSFATFIAGALCPMLLADLGADVVKVEPLEGDPFRAGTTFGFLGWNRGTRSLSLDLRRPEAREALLRLVDRADLVVDNYRPGVLARLGLDAATLRARNPGILRVSLPGYGPIGPLADRPGFDPILQARSGLVRAQGGAEPVFYAVPYTDYATATLGALAAVCAVVARESDVARGGAGEGQSAWSSLLNAACVMQAGALVDHAGKDPDPPTGHDLRGSSPCRRAYACRDGWVFVSAEGEADRERLLQALGVGRGGPLDDPAVRIAAALASRATADVLSTLADAGVAAVACPRFPEIVADPHLHANRLWWSSHHPELGDVTQTGEVISFARTPMRLGPVAPRLGEHTREILAEIGIDDATVTAWLESRIARALDPSA